MMGLHRLSRRVPFSNSELKVEERWADHNYSGRVWLSCYWAQEVVGTVVEHSTSFKIKTKYSQEKYINKKKKK